MNSDGMMSMNIASGKGAAMDLGDGLLLRRATQQDVDALSAFNGRIHRPDVSEEPDERIAAWTFE